MRVFLRRLRGLLPWACVLFTLEALARAGGGQSYSSGRSHGGGGPGGGGGGLPVELIFFAIQYPEVSLPVLLVGGLFWFWYQKNLSPTATTQHAFELQEAEWRTSVSQADIKGWVTAISLKDPAFELQAVMNKVQTLFVMAQDAWVRGKLENIRPFVSDSVFQRFRVQLELMRGQGLRNVLAELAVLEVSPVGFDQTAFFDTLHVRVKAQARDVDVPLQLSDQEATARAQQVPPETFIEVWSFVRRPGAPTRRGKDLYEGKCPNCGAPFNGGATNNCEFCKAVVNSGNYDWTLAKITQGVEAIRGYSLVDGLLQAREQDPALNLETLEDRTSLIFWRWIEAFASLDSRKLLKLARPECVADLNTTLQGLKDKRQKRVYLKCAVGAVQVRELRLGESNRDEAHVEVRWSAQGATVPLEQSSFDRKLPVVPHRAMLVLARAKGATTFTSTGLSTSRCPQCHAPLTDSATPQCDYCHALLSSGERDWVLVGFYAIEEWSAMEERRFQMLTNARRPEPSDEVVTDLAERQRILYLMAALAMADGTLEPTERRLLKACSDRWGVAWSNVELALQAGPSIVDRLIHKDSPGAEMLLRYLVRMALVDGRVDRKERQLLEKVSQRLGLEAKLPDLLRVARQPPPAPPRPSGTP
jgi:tellurite resistance protein